MNRYAFLTMVFSSLTIVFYFNASVSSEVTPQQLINYSKELSLKINSSTFSDAGKVLLKKNKIVALNYLSAKIRAANCQELLAADSSMLTGVYRFYPSKKITEGTHFFCEINNSQVTAATELPNDQQKATNCLKTDSCSDHEDFYQKFSCESTPLQRSYCNVQNVYGNPILIQATAGNCTENTYGADEQGIWVSNGCAGQFVAKRLPDSKQIPSSPPQLKNCNHNGLVIEHNKSITLYSSSRSGNCTIPRKSFVCNNGSLPLDIAFYRYTRCEER